jgi:uncharacterized membrane protein
MDSSYREIAGQSSERLAAISDGIFGVAMTLLLLELHTPEKVAIQPGDEWALFHALAGNLPMLLVYLMSFMTLGIFWVGQQTQLNYLDRSDRNLTWLHLGFLFPVTIVPFSTRLLTNFISYKVALLFYWLNILVLGALLYACWRYTVRAGLVVETAQPGIPAAICRRILIAQVLYGAGAGLCFVSTSWSIAFIVMVQLNYVIEPMAWLKRPAGAAQK